MKGAVWLLIATVLVVATVDEASSAPERPLRFVTFNMLHGGASSGLVGDGQGLERRLAMTVEALRALDADVIGLQEASIGRQRGNVAQRLADQLGLHHVHAPATERVFGSHVFGRLIVWLLNLNEGPAILSRFPIVNSQTYDLPRCQRFHDPRVLLRAEIETPRGRLNVYSTHTSREGCQTDHVAEVARRHADALPSVVMGDFNAAETSPAIAGLAEAGFVDVFRRANPTAPGLTVWQQVEVPHPTVFRRVDYVFLLPGTAFRGTVVSSSVVLDRPGRLPDGRPLWPSDHYGVLAEIDVFPPGAARVDQGRR